MIHLSALAGYARLAPRLASDLRSALRRLDRSAAELSVVLVGDRRMRTLNLRTRRIDRTTDVLSFPAARTPGSRLLGDLVICVPLARRRATALGRTLRAELRLYAIHGLLHLLGHDHLSPRDRRRMAQAEQQLLGETGLIARAEPQAEVEDRSA